MSLPKTVLAAGVHVVDEVSCKLCQILEVPERDNKTESECATKARTLAVTGVKEYY